MTLIYSALRSKDSINSAFPAPLVIREKIVDAPERESIENVGNAS